MHSMSEHLVQIARDIEADVDEAAGDEGLLEYAAGRAERRLRNLTAPQLVEVTPEVRLGVVDTDTLGLDRELVAYA